MTGGLPHTLAEALEALRPAPGPNAGIRHAFTVCAHYVDKLVRTPEGWRIAERIEKQVIFEGALPEKI
jgi:hypothetical protein